MTLARSLLGMTARSSLEDPQIPISSATVASLFGGDQITDAGVTVSPASSLNMSAVWRGTSVVSGVSSSLPLKAYSRKDRKEVSRQVIDEPHPEMTSLEVWRLSYVHRCLWGNSYAFKVRSRVGEVVEVHPLEPGRVQVGRVRGVPGGKLFGVTLDDGHMEPFTSKDILHIPGLGYDGVTGCSPVRAARAGIGLSLAAEKYGSRLFGSGSLVGGVLQTEQRLEPEIADALKQRWQAKMSGVGRSHEVAVLDSGAKFQTVTMPNSDAQFIESRRFQISEIARFWGVPPSLLMDTDKSTSWGTGLEQQASGFVKFDLYPSWLAPTEARVTKELLPAAEYAEYTVDALMRGDAVSRAMFYRVMREVGAFSANDIRDLENKVPIENGDVYLQPLNLAPLGYDPTAHAASQGASE